MQPCVLYVRVSSERQAQEGGGLQSQEQRCRSYALNCGYTVLHTFADDGVSGALIQRPGIQALLAFLQQQPQQTVVVIDDISRIARDVIAHVSLRSAIKAAGGRLESPSFTFGESAADELVETIMAATAQYGRKGNREQVLHRQKSRLELGYWTFPAPPGYRYEKHPVHKKVLVPTLQTKRVLVPALEGLASGRLPTRRAFALYLQEQGFFQEQGYFDTDADLDTQTGVEASANTGMSKQVSLSILEKRVTRILDVLPFYAGYIEYPRWNVERVSGHHEAILSPVLLARLQARLQQTARPVAAPRADADAHFILRNFVRCSGCGRPLTGSLAKGKYPRYYCYCKEGCDRYGHSLSARLLEPAFEELLHSLAPSEEFLQIAELFVSKGWQQSVGEWASESKRIERQIEAIQADVSGLVRRLGRASDLVATEIEAQIAALKSEQARLQAQGAEYGQTPPDFAAAWERVSTWFRHPAEQWIDGSETQKRTVHRLVFTVPPAFDRNRGFSTYELTLPYRVSTTFAGSSCRMVDFSEKSWHDFLTKILEWEQLLIGLEKYESHRS